MVSISTLPFDLSCLSVKETYQFLLSLLILNPYDKIQYEIIILILNYKNFIRNAIIFLYFYHIIDLAKIFFHALARYLYFAFNPESPFDKILSFRSLIN